MQLTECFFDDVVIVVGNTRKLEYSIVSCCDEIFIFATHSYLNIQRFKQLILC
jgi:hypothetical protein